MAESSRMSATDVLSVRSRVSWAAIAAGAMVALAVYFLFTLLGAAIGLEVAIRRSTDYLAPGAALYSIFTLLLAMFLGGWSVSRLAVGESKLEAVLYGVILWGVLFVGMFWMIGAGVRLGFEALMGVASGAVTVVVDEPARVSDQGALNTLVQRYSSQLGGQKFVDDLKKMGVDEEKAKNIEGMVSQRLEGIRSASAPAAQQARDLANDPAVQQAATRALATTRQATWYTLIGVIVSMATVIIGSLAGSGDLPIPVPVLYVRRPTPGSRA